MSIEQTNFKGLIYFLVPDYISIVLRCKAKYMFSLFNTLLQYCDRTKNMLQKSVSPRPVLIICRSKNIQMSNLTPSPVRVHLICLFFLMDRTMIICSVKHFVHLCLGPIEFYFPYFIFSNDCPPPNITYFILLGSKFFGTSQISSERCLRPRYTSFLVADNTCTSQGITLPNSYYHLWVFRLIKESPTHNQLASFDPFNPW